MALRWLKIAVPLAAVALAGGGYLAYSQVANAKSTTAVNVQQVDVRRGNLEIVVNTSGSVAIPTRAQGKLAFGVAGNIATLPVDTGDEVKKGQILGKLDTSDLGRDVQQAEFNLKNAQLAVEKAKSPYTEGDIAKAEANVTAAKANLAASVSNLEKVKNPYTAADIAKQRAVVAQAKANLRTAQGALDDSRNPFPEVQSARSALEAMDRQVGIAVGALRQTAAPTAPDVARAHDALFTAVSNADNALDWIDKGKTNQKNLTAGLETIRRNDLNTIGAEATAVKALVTAAEQSLVTAQGSIALSVPLYKVEVDRAQAIYDQTKASFNQQQVSQAEMSRKAADLQVAMDKLAQEQGRAGQALAQALRSISTLATSQEQLYKDIDNMLASQADPTDLEVKQSQVNSSQANQLKAQEDLDKQLSGADPVDVQKAEASLASARASLKTTEEELAKLQAGGDPNDVATKENQRSNAQVALDRAKDQITKATMVAPFDGVIAAVSVEEGTSVGASTVVLQIVDPSKAELHTNVDEVDVLRLRPGQIATLTMDALPGVTLTGSVRTISFLATSQSGVVTYDVTLDILPTESPAGSQVRRPNASTGAVAGSGGQPALRRTPTAGAPSQSGATQAQASGAPQASATPGQPAPRRTPLAGAPPQSGATQAPRASSGLGVPLRQGLTVLVRIVVDQRESVLLAPVRAVRQSGRDRIVKVLVNGLPEERKVTIGLSDGQNVEVLEGLVEGDTVLIEPIQRASATPTTSTFGLPSVGGARPAGR
ncbi:MAG: HlyD family efflux transporter periplasmic adaptor subunit [Dehalococcoidia bacterium]|nr:HlyD family efflux transporter periplasmic adaptor subunit [Dehalococcoidia bacterium]